MDGQILEVIGQERLCQKRLVKEQVMKGTYCNECNVSKERRCKSTCSVITNTSSAVRGNMFCDCVCAWQDQSRHLICKVTITSFAKADLSFHTGHIYLDTKNKPKNISAASTLSYRFLIIFLRKCIRGKIGAVVVNQAMK